MQMTRREILDTVLRRAGELGDSVARNRAESELDLALTDLWISQPWRSLVMDHEFDTVASQGAYALPYWFGRFPLEGANGPIIRNLSRGGEEIAIVERSEAVQLHTRIDADDEVAGEVVMAYLDGVSGVTTQPLAAGSAIEVVSDSTDDVAVRATVEGYDASGVAQITEVELNGTTAVAMGTWSKVWNFSKGYPTGTAPATEHLSSVGTVTLQYVGSTAMQALLPWQSAQDHARLRLVRMPVRTGDTLSVPMIRTIQAMRYGSQELPRFWGPVVLDMVMAGWRSGDRTKRGSDQLEQLGSYRNLVAFDNSAARGRTARGRAFTL